MKQGLRDQRRLLNCVLVWNSRASGSGLGEVHRRHDLIGALGERGLKRPMVRLDRTNGGKARSGNARLALVHCERCATGPEVRRFELRACLTVLFVG